MRKKERKYRRRAIIAGVDLDIDFNRDGDMVVWCVRTTTASNDSSKDWANEFLLGKTRKTNNAKCEHA